MKLLPPLPCLSSSIQPETLIGTFRKTCCIFRKCYSHCGTECEEKASIYLNLTCGDTVDDRCTVRNSYSLKDEER